MLKTFPVYNDPQERYESLLSENSKNHLGLNQHVHIKFQSLLYKASWRAILNNFKSREFDQHLMSLQ